MSNTKKTKAVNSPAPVIHVDPNAFPVPTAGLHVSSGILPHNPLFPLDPFENPKSGSTFVPTKSKITAPFKYHPKQAVSVTVPENTFFTSGDGNRISVGDELRNNFPKIVQVLEWWYEELEAHNWIDYFTFYDINKETNILWDQDDTESHLIREGRKEFVAELWTLARETKKNILRQASLGANNPQPIMKFHKQNGVMYHTHKSNNVKLREFFSGELDYETIQILGKQHIANYLDSIEKNVIDAFYLQPEELRSTLIPEIIDIWVMLYEPRFYDWFMKNMVTWVIPTLPMLESLQVSHKILNPEFYKRDNTNVNNIGLTIREILVTHAEYGITPDLLFRMSILNIELKSLEDVLSFAESDKNLPLDWLLEIILNNEDEAKK